MQGFSGLFHINRDSFELIPTCRPFDLIPTSDIFSNLFLLPKFSNLFLLVGLSNLFLLEVYFRTSPTSKVFELIPTCRPFDLIPTSFFGLIPTSSFELIPHYLWNYGVIGKNLTSPNANINAYIRFYDVERIEKCYYHFPWKYISCLPKSQSYA